MPVNVLEIGYGSDPAVETGALFENPEVFYTGIELPKEFKGSFMVDSYPYDFPQTTASMDAMPFRDETFDYVLLRSVYGQFEARPNIVWSVRMGIYECLRVIKPEGCIVIAEENTPKSIEYIASEISHAGFVIEAAQRMTMPWEQTPNDDEYKRARSPFYRDRPLLNGVSRYFGAPNIVIGRKPADLELKEVREPMSINFYNESKNPDDWRSKVLTFKMPAHPPRRVSEF